MSLEGSSIGETRKAIHADAIATTALYYGIDCVGIKLTNERIEDGDLSGSHLFAAAWEGYIEHLWDKPTYGFPQCRKCGISDYGKEA
jgi:hypothetical protein